MKLGTLVAVSLALFTSAATFANGDSVLAIQKTIQEVYERHRSAVVRVKVATDKIEENGQSSVSLIVFSGFFINSKGQVLTNRVPMKDANRVWIEKDGITYLADVIGSDARTNVSLLQAINLPPNFSYIDIASNMEKPSIASFAVAITSPLDFAPSPKFGIVTGFESHFAEMNFPFTYTRVGIPIGPAEGGSPVFDASGRLMGITMATLPEVNSSYIIPSKALSRIVSDFSEYGKVRYGVLPIEIEEKPDRYSGKQQLAVKSVVAGSPAHKAGVKAGDILVKIDDQAVTSLNDARDLLFYIDPGKFVNFTVSHEEKELKFSFMLEPIEDHIEKSDTE